MQGTLYTDVLNSSSPQLYEVATVIIPNRHMRELSVICQVAWAANAGAMFEGQAGGPRAHIPDLHVLGHPKHSTLGPL